MNTFSIDLINRGSFDSDVLYNDYCSIIARWKYLTIDSDGTVCAWVNMPESDADTGSWNGPNPMIRLCQTNEPVQNFSQCISKLI